MKDGSPHAELGRMITAYWVSQAIYAAAALGIADLLKDGAKSVDDLAVEADAKPDHLYRLLRGLASVGIFAEEGESRRFALTPLAEPLRRDGHGSLRSLALMTGGEQYQAWGHLVESVRTGEIAFDRVFGKSIFEFLGEHPEEAQIFDDAMTGIHGRETGPVLEAYDFSDIGVLADIGGGNGSKIAAILGAYPDMQGILFDLPHVVERARASIEAAGLGERCRLEGGDFFQSVPSGADAYVMRHIIHDWDDEQSLRILRNCHAAMAPGSRLLLVESVIPPGNEPFMGKFLDLTMMVIPGGKERTEHEYRALYEQSGFELTRIVPTSAEVSVIEGVRR